MIIYCDNELKIKSVNLAKDGLTAYELTDENPFNGWNSAKICCYRVGLIPEAKDGEITGKWVVTMFTPYVDSRLIPHFEQIENDVVNNTQNISLQEDGLAEILYELSLLELGVNPLDV